MTMTPIHRHRCRTCLKWRNCKRGLCARIEELTCDGCAKCSRDKKKKRVPVWKVKPKS